MDAPPKGDLKTARKSKKDPKESCYTCGVPLSTHLGKPGPGNCFGAAVTKAFSDLIHLVQKINTNLHEERREAHDRVDRLNRKIGELSRQPTDAGERGTITNAKLENLDKSFEQSEKHVGAQRRPSAKPGKRAKAASQSDETVSNNDETEEPIPWHAVTTVDQFSLDEEDS